MLNTATLPLLFRLFWLEAYGISNTMNQMSRPRVKSNGSGTYSISCIPEKMLKTPVDPAEFSARNTCMDWTWLLLSSRFG